jgi:hypothetical protein
MRSGGTLVVIVPAPCPQAVQPDLNNHRHRKGSADGERNGFKGTIHVASFSAKGGRPLPPDWAQTSVMCITLADRC